MGPKALSRLAAWNLGVGSWDAELLWSLEFGVCSLEFSLRSLRRGQFATGEQGDSAQRDDATKEKDHLTDSQAKLAPRHAAAGAQRINRRKVLGQPDHAEHLREHPESGLIEE